MSSLQSNERSRSESDKSESGRLSTASSVSNTASTGISSVAPTKTVVETETATATATITTATTATITKATTATITITTTATVTATTTPSGGDTGLSSGGIAGIAVASAITAIALASFAFLYLNRRKLHLAPKMSPIAPPQTPVKELGAATGFVGLPNRCLLTGESDSEIKKQLSSLGFLIHHHVEGHYHCDKIVATPEDLFTSLRQLQLPEATCSMIVRLSIDPRTRYVAIRHLLALVIFSNLDVHNVGSLSLLPPTLKELYHSRVKASTEEPDSLAGTALLSWHRITAFLLHENPQMGTPLLPPPSVDSQVKALINLLQEFLVHFVRIDSGHSIEDQQTGLAGVFNQCVEYGYEVFSHPSDWEFTYPQEEQGIAVVPGLKQHSSNRGELYDPPRIVLTAEIAAIRRTTLIRKRQK